MKSKTKVLLSVVLLSVVCAFAPGCATQPARVTYQVSAGTHVTVKTALAAWDQYIATHPVSLETELKVKSAFEKYKAAQLIVLDMAISYKRAVDAGLENATLLDQFTAATNNAAQTYADLIGLLTQIGIKL